MYSQWIFTLLILIWGCGKESTKYSEDHSQSPVISTNEKVQPSGQYLAILKNINPKFNPYIRGSGTISIEGIEIVADVSLSGGEKNQLYSQQIRKGSRCPDKREDVNEDGYIDIIEAQKVIGEILFPLDGDISSQLSFDSVFPIADEYGSYTYSKITDFHLFLQDLYSPKLIYSPYMKLKRDELFNPEDMLLIIQGLSNDHILPFTVKSIPRLNPNQSLPIACAEFRKVLQIPGVIDE